MRKILSLTLFMFLFISCSNDSSSNKVSTDALLQAAVDSSFAAATHKVGISVAVYKDGYTWSYAKGNAIGGTAMTTSTPAYAYSVTKTIVSALVLTQIENGLYTLDDTVSGLLSDDADYNGVSADQIALLNTSAKVSQLLSHTSGMPDYAGNLTDLIPMCDPTTSWKPADILEKIVYLPVANIGTFQYSNTNYVLLGMIAEHKGGKTLNTLLSETFFSKIGIDAVIAPQDTIPSTIAHPYDDAYLLGAPAVGTFMDLTMALESKYPTYNYYLGVGRATWAAGGIIAIAEDLAIWGFELYDADGTAISSAARAILKASAPDSGDYGYGVSYNTFTYTDGTTGEEYGHGGSAPGYKSLLRYDATQHMAVAIMTNENNIYGAAIHADATDSELGIVDREALAKAIFSAYKSNN